MALSPPHTTLEAPLTCLRVPACSKHHSTASVGRKVTVPWAGRAHNCGSGSHDVSVLQVSLPWQVMVLVPSACGGPGHDPSPTHSSQGTLRVCEVTEFHGPKACGAGVPAHLQPKDSRASEKVTLCGEPATLQVLTPEARTRGRRCSRRSHSAIQVKEDPGLARAHSTPPGHHGPWLAAASGVGSLPRCDRHQGLRLL